ncbi:PREDICTED: protein TBATA [Elephantulus edwardii]|uniref:protein TBATA n=1 Tax=Elephantulus edwardii TaxID=28737 RepID=UPI0003F0C9DE|nr:PREDICTED: protein TBATA [Elephantulus edwardii]
MGRKTTKRIKGPGSHRARHSGGHRGTRPARPRPRAQKPGPFNLRCPQAGVEAAGPSSRRPPSESLRRSSLPPSNPKADAAPRLRHILSDLTPRPLPRSSPSFVPAVQLRIGSSSLARNLLFSPRDPVHFHLPTPEPPSPLPGFGHSPAGWAPPPAPLTRDRLTRLGLELPLPHGRASRDCRSSSGGGAAPPRPETAPAAPALRSERSACAAPPSVTRTSGPHCEAQATRLTRRVCAPPAGGMRAGRCGPGQPNIPAFVVMGVMRSSGFFLLDKGIVGFKGNVPKAELSPGKKPGSRPQNHRDSKLQKEPVVPGIVDFKLTNESARTPKIQSPSTYRFGCLSHHSFFSRHHPHPQRVTHIQDLTGKPVCVVRDKFFMAPSPLATLSPQYLMGMPTISAPVGDPQSNRDPQLSSEAWKRELRDLASRVVVVTKKNEMKNQEEKEEPQREQGAKYSAETGRIIPASTRAMTRRSSHQSQHSHPAGPGRGAQSLALQNQELLILELLSQILQTDSLSAIQSWLLSAPQKEKDLALALLQTAMAQVLPKPLISIPAEKLLLQLQEVQELAQEKQQMYYSQSLKKMKTPPTPEREKPESIGTAQVLRVHSSQNSEEKASGSEAES